MAQDVGTPGRALFVEKAEASVADSTVTRHAASASERVPGMLRARNMAGPLLRRGSTTYDTFILAQLFHIAIAKPR